MLVRLALFPLLLLAAAARAADAPAASPAVYSVHATLSQKGNICLLKFAIIKTDGSLKSEIATRPAIQLSDGQSAEVMVDEGAAAGAPATAAAGVGDKAPPPFSGYRLAVFKPITTTQATYVFTVVKNGVITHAITGTVAPAPATRPAL
jgi:hypothetical protein